MHSWEEIVEEFNKRLDEIPKIYENEHGGRARSSAGKIFEDLLNNLCKINNLEPKKNDYIKSEIVDGNQIKLQVDRHIYRNGELIKLVESKTYLDLCYLKRAITDFTDLYESPYVSKNVDYAIFTGQISGNENTFNFHTKKFKRDTGKDLKIFVFNNRKERDSKRPIYIDEYKKDFYLDENVIKEFIQWLVQWNYLMMICLMYWIILKINL